MTIRTFRQLQDDALRWFDEVHNESELRENVKQALNVAQVARLSERNWPFMKWPGKGTFTTVPGEQHYALHEEFFRPVYFRSQTDGRWLRQISDEGLTWNLERESPDRFEFEGISPVMRQPEEPSTLNVTSSSGADGTQQAVRVWGETAAGMLVEELIPTGGTGTTLFKRILRLTKFGVWSGTMTLKAGVVPLVQLGSHEVGKQFQVLKLLQPPTIAETFEYPFYRKPLRMVQDLDIPDIPAPFQDILVYDALLDLATYNDVEKNAVEIWSARQHRLEQGLINAHSGEALSLERDVNYVHWTPRD